MPLDTQIERPSVVANSLDDAIRRQGHHFHCSRVVHRLSMMTLNEPTPKFPCNGMLFPIPVIRRRCQRIGQVLIESAPRVQSHELHTEANAKGGLGCGLLECGEDRPLKRLALWVNRGGAGMLGHSPIGHDRIVAAGEHEAITPAHKIGRS